MCAAVVLRNTAKLQPCRSRCHIFAVLSGVVVMRWTSGIVMTRWSLGGGRIAHHRAHRPRDRQAGQNSEQDDGDAVSPTHGSSIPRLPEISASATKRPFQRAVRLNRNALPITEMELNVIAALAMIGLSKRPKNA